MTPGIRPLTIPRPRQNCRSGTHFGSGRARSESLEDLSHLVGTRRARLRHLLQMRAPEIIVRNERRMLRSAVSAMLEAARALATEARDDTSFAPVAFDLTKPGGAALLPDQLLGADMPRHPE